MLKVIIELHPHGISKAGWIRRVGGPLYIGNDGSGDSEIGNYVVFDRHPRRGGKIIARVSGHPRSLGPWPLVRRAIAACEEAARMGAGT